MTMSDPIADMLTRIRNGNVAKHDTVDVPASKMKQAIADILVREGYIKKYEVVSDGNAKNLRIYMKYGKDKSEKVITGIKRISKPGLRVYAGKDDMPRVLGGLGTAIISTNKGIVTDKGEHNRWIRSATTMLRTLGERIKTLVDWLSDARAKLERQHL